MEKSYDIAIIGGGIIGCSIAYYLAKEHVAVTVLESGQVGRRTTSAAAGMLGAHSECDDLEVFYPFARSSQIAYSTLEKELKDVSGIDIRRTAGGIFKLAYNEAEKIELLRLCSLPTVMWQGVSEIGQMIPAVSNEILGAAYIPDDVNVLPEAVCGGLSLAAQIHGADFYEYTQVLDICKSGSNYTVQTQTGNIEAKYVVIASGVWSNSFFERLGLKNRIVPVKGECLSVLQDELHLKHTLFHEHCYIMPRDNGRIVIGATMVENDWSEKPTLGGTEKMMTKAKTMLPAIEKMKIDSIWAGLRPKTFDGKPFIGFHPEQDHILFAAGHFRNGILLAPATGQMIRNLILGKEVRKDWIEAFRIDRNNDVFV